MSVIYVIFDVNSVTGTTQECECCENIRTCNVRITDKLQKLAHCKIRVTRFARTRINYIFKFSMKKYISRSIMPTILHFVLSKFHSLDFSLIHLIFFSAKEHFKGKYFGIILILFWNGSRPCFSMSVSK